MSTKNPLRTEPSSAPNLVGHGHFIQSQQKAVGPALHRRVQRHMVGRTTQPLRSGAMVPSRGSGPAPAHAWGRGGPAAAALFTQVLILGLLGVWAAAAAIGGGSGDRVSLALLALLTLTMGVGLAFVARGLANGRRWARSPAVVWELIMVPVGVSLAQGIPLAGAVVLATAAVVLVGTFASTRRQPEARAPE
jgi:hypothetical protein